MSDATAIRVPVENVNDEIVKLTAWRVQEGQEVQEGQLLAEIETSKAVVEMIAPVSGKVWLRVMAGRDVPVSAIVAYITTNGSAPPADKPENVPGTGDGSSPTGSMASTLPPGTSFSKKALELMQQHQITPHIFAGRGMIREMEITEYLARQVTGFPLPAESVHFALKGLPLDLVTLPETFADTKSGLIDPEFLKELKANPNSFAALSSNEKSLAYRKHGAVVGDGVVFGPGTIVIAPQIIIGDEVIFGKNSLIQCRERFCIGRLSSFRENLNITGGTVVLGENIWGGTDVRIGGGGSADPWSLLCVGDEAYLGDSIYINICRPILIGTNVFLTQRSIVMTHNIGHSVLDGCENRFAPVVLGDFSQIGMYVTIYPGTTIGRSAVVTSNSYVISSIPAGKLAMGVPARVIRDAARPPDRNRQLHIVQTMVREFHELLALKGRDVSPLVTGHRPEFKVDYEGKRFQFVFIEKFSASESRLEPADETVVWTFESASEPEAPHCIVMNLLTKEIAGTLGVFGDSAREFLRKRGVRCRPVPWRYRKGLI